ncbi:glutamate ligase domain-containing protein [Bacillaceae bacterium W0354]
MGEVLFQRLMKRKVNVKSVGITKAAHLMIDDVNNRFFINRGNIVDVCLAMPGLHNLYNAAVTVLAGSMLNLEQDKVLKALTSLKNIPGRFEIFYFPGNITVVVDYAHTAKGIFFCLNAIRECGARRIFHVFGFRGKRDSSKRPLMLKNSIEMADYTVLTFDDLNGVSPEEMDAELKRLRGDVHEAHCEIITDRTRAIEKAIGLANHGDWIVITGKGHEKYKEKFSLDTTSDVETIEKLYLEKLRVK